MKHVGILQSVQVGIPKRDGEEGAVDPMKRLWETSFFRTPTTQPRWLFTTHLEGNLQTNTKIHRDALLLYASLHYLAWQKELNLPEIGPGGFGENFTVDGLTEKTVCIGDIYAVGDARIQVTEPRYPCWKIERRWGIVGLAAHVAETGRTGWYCKVIREGMIRPGLPISLIEQPYPTWTIAMINHMAHHHTQDKEKASLAHCPLLPEFWRRLILRSTIDGS